MSLYRMGFIYLINTGRRLEQAGVDRRNQAGRQADRVESELFLVAYVVFVGYLNYSFEDN